MGISRIAPTLLLLILALGMISIMPATAQPREETVITGGAWWSPPTNFNPLTGGAATPGVVGLMYEPLYLWIPVKTDNQWVPWLAADLPNWISDSVVEIKLRSGLTWWDGQPLTASDVKFTYLDLPKMVPGTSWSGMANYIDHIDVVDSTTLRIYFTSNPNYHNFIYNLYQVPILPEHIVKPLAEKYGNDLADASRFPALNEDKDPFKIVASGMYKLYDKGDTYVTWVRVDTWWGKNVFGKLPAPKYVKGVIVYSNQVAANMLGAGELDWSTFFIPGGPDMVNRGLAVAYYKKSPYYLPANVAYLFVNTQKKPFDDPVFRKAMYYAIDVDSIIASAFEGAVLKSNPVGLIETPAWQKYLATDLIQQYNYTYDPNKAKQLLDSAGYIDRDGDGWRDLPNGKRIEVKIIVPYGWTDWMFAAINIAESLKKVGIYAEASFPDYGAYVTMIDTGDFDAAINNFGSAVSPTPYTLYYWAFRATPGIWTGNHGRVNITELNQLIDQLAATPPTNENQLKNILRQIQQILLDQMPALPLWYNGFWFLATTKYWTNWPSSDNPYGVPTNWNGNWQLGGMLTLLNIQPVQTTTTPGQAPGTTTPSGVDYTLIGIVVAIVVVVAIIGIWLATRGKKGGK